MSKKQLEIPGTERKTIKELEDAAERYAKIRDERMKWTAKESELKKEVLGLMKKHKIKNYESEEANLTIEVIVEKEKLKVKVAGDDEGEE